MDLASILGVGVTLALAIFGGVMALGKLFQTVNDQGSDITDLKDTIKGQRADIDKAQDAAGQVAGLAKAVETLAERVGLQLEHMVQIVGLQNEHVKSELSDIKAELGRRTSTRERRVS